MDHDRPLPRAILRDVLQVEALRQLEIDLHGRIGELPTVGVVHLEIDLRSVERGLTGADLVLLAHRLQRFGERGLRFLPELFCPQPLVLDFVTCGQLVPELVDAQHLGEVQGQVDRPLHLIHQLAGGAEDMRVIQREGPDPIHPGERARALVAPVVADLGDPQGQVSIAAKLGLIDDDVMRAVDGPELELLAVLELHRRVHVLGVELRVSALPKQVEPRDVGCPHVLIPARELFVDDESFELAADGRPVRQPQR